MKHTYSACYKEIVIRPLTGEDIEVLRIWRNDSTLATFLKPIKKITSGMQKKWFEEYLLDDNSIFFVIEHLELKRVVGALAIYNFKEGKSEIGKIIIGDAEARGKGYGYLALVMAMEIANKELGIQDFYLDCHENNISAMKNYLRVGYRKIGEHPFENGGKENEMQIDYNEFQKKNKEVIADIVMNSNLEL